MSIVAKLELIVITTYCVIVQCFSKCQMVCTACQNDRCYSCKDGYFLYDLECVECPVTCQVCSSLSDCYACKHNYWNLTSQCDMQCPSNCLSGCDVATGYCFGCKSNFYGRDCALSCSLCRNGNCDYQGCISGCQDGYFQDNYQEYSICRQCSPNCSKCETFYNCTECLPYFYRHDYIANKDSRSVCTPCSPGCANCIDVDRCLSCQHINYCKECKYNGTGYTCSVCEKGYTSLGGQCYAERQCPVGCLNGCDKGGACYQCRDGFTGNACNERCGDLCLKCSKESPYMCEQCTDADLITPTCTKHCSENCLKINGKSACLLKNGNCLNGCMAGRWGNKCENNCSINCLQNANLQPECSMLTGSCNYGCMSGFTGLDCDGKITATETLNTTYRLSANVGKPSVAEDKSYPLAVVVGALAGGIVVGAASVIVVFILWKRLRKKSQFRSNVYENAGIDISQHYDNTASSLEMNVPTSETSMYEHLSEKTIENNYSVLSK